MTLSHMKDAAAILSSLVTAGAAVAALLWFLYTRSFKRRIQFDADLHIFDLGPPHDYVAELVLTVENRGQREHRLYNLWCEVRQSRTLASADGIKSFLPVTNLVPEAMTYFFILAGVKQEFPTTFTIPRQEKLVRVMAMFTYELKRLHLEKLDHLTFEALDQINVTTHSVSKLFAVKSTCEHRRSSSPA